MPEYFEDPTTGEPIEPPRLTLDQYNQMRPFHLTEEIARAEEHLTDLLESRAKLEKRLVHPSVTEAKVAETDRMADEARKFIEELRRQAGEELTADQFKRLLASAADRRKLNREFQAIIAQAGVAEVGN